MPCSNKTLLTLEMGARSSPLSKAQVKEVIDALLMHYPSMQFNVHYMSTLGDRDQVTSLRTFDRTDFFTRDIDQWVLEKEERVGIHSAKDLPHTLAKGLNLFCLTKGVDPSDSLVLRAGETLQSLPSGARIATSSIRREDIVRQLKSDLNFCDIRGTIEQRLAKLETGEVDGVVVAEAALIRLGLRHLARIRLPGPTAEGQGQLAVVGHQANHAMKHLFAFLNTR